MLNEYEITVSTLIILSNNKKSIVIDEEGEHNVNISTLKLLDNNCKNYGYFRFHLPSKKS